MSFRVETTARAERGLRYRLLYLLRGQTVYILHVRGPGQDLMGTEDVEIPASSD